ncbi:hypothetical protein BCR39DRAFT_370713 [Naematelia encephala]|uniref:Uncharacterized protein n=1 Tax=Naematelia encephala TaxID=71784 RepID=A0A1Y2AJV3_9TREE|nr:hypothetical protein BCR39DRAFT_370713 [Naematelia encephala]
MNVLHLEEDARLFPGCQKPSALEYNKVHDTPLSDSDMTIFDGNTTSRAIHYRLLRLAAHHTRSISVFPFLVTPLEGKAAIYHRGSRLKRDDDRYTITLSSLMSWELGQRRLRVGLVESANSPGTPFSHVWAFALYSRDEVRGKGKDLILFDDTAEDLRSEYQGQVTFNEITADQRRLISILRKRHVRVEDVMVDLVTTWGSKAATCAWSLRFDSWSALGKTLKMRGESSNDCMTNGTCNNG